MNPILLGAKIQTAKVLSRVLESRINQQITLTEVKIALTDVEVIKSRLLEIQTFLSHAENHPRDTANDEGNQR